MAIVAPSRPARRARALAAAALAVCTVLPASVTRATQSDTYPWTLQQLADGVWAATQPAERRFDESNSLIVLGDEGVTLVDTQSNPDAVRDLLARVREITPLPVVRVVNTHWHGDHTQGNAIVRAAFPDVDIVGHVTLVQDVPERAAGFVAERLDYYDAELPGAHARLERGVFRDGSAMSDEDRAAQAAAIARAEAWVEANRGAEFLPPTHTYENRVDLKAGAHTLQLIHVRAHTRGDTLVWLPDEGILATGDVVDDLPYIGHGYPAEWVEALTRVLQLPVRVVVPGHGPVFEGTGQIETVRGYLGALVGQVRGAVAEGYDLETTLAGLGLGRWRTALARDATGEEFFDAVLPEAVERAWLEARGEIED